MVNTNKICVVGILSGIIILIIIWNILYIHTNEYKFRCGSRNKNFRKLPKSGLDGIVIGSSQAYYGFDFELFGYSIANLAGNPESLQMCCQIAKENIQRVKKGGVLLICIPFAGGYSKDIQTGFTMKYIIPFSLTIG